MPADERPEPCDRHPGSPSVARCDGCGRPMCLACATPVRGEVFGAECLASVLGSALAASAEPPARAPRARARAIARLGFLLAVLSTILQWSRFGPGSEAFGAWSRANRWSVLAGVAAVLGLGLTALQRSPRLRTAGWDAVAAVLAATVTVASLLALANPPAFSRPWLGPWIAAAAGAIAFGATVVASRTRTPTTVRI